MANVWSVPEALRTARLSAGYTLREAAQAAYVSRSTLSDWERGAHRPGTEEIQQLDAAYRQRGALVQVVSALRRADALPPERSWGFHPDGGQVWAWFRSSVAATAEVQWGPWRVHVDVPASPESVVVTSPISIANPPVLVRFDQPAHVDLYRGRPPLWLGAQLVNGLGLLEPDVAPHAALTWLGRRLAAVAPTVLESTVGLRGGVALVLQSRKAARLPAVEAEVIPPSAIDLEAHVDHALAKRVREAFVTSQERAAEAASALPGAPPITTYALRRLEEGDALNVAVAAALDSLFGLDGRLVRAPLHHGTGLLESSFLKHWRGPIWVAFNDVPAAGSDVHLTWDGVHKPLRVTDPSLVTCRKSTIDAGPLRVDAPGCRISTGIGRHPTAIDVNDRWDLHPRVFAEYRDMLLEPLVHRIPALSRLIRGGSVS